MSLVSAAKPLPPIDVRLAAAYRRLECLCRECKHATLLNKSPLPTSRAITLQPAATEQVFRRSQLVFISDRIIVRLALQGEITPLRKTLRTFVRTRLQPKRCGHCNLRVSFPQQFFALPLTNLLWRNTATETDEHTPSEPLVKLIGAIVDFSFQSRWVVKAERPLARLHTASQVLVLSQVIVRRIEACIIRFTRQVT